MVIVGSGLGGLACATIMAKEGQKVLVLEKNKQIGGNLQTYVRDRVIFDSGVHYVGGLDKGQNLYQLFRYLGIMHKLKIRKMDEDVFDAVIFEGDPVVYKFAQGYENFITTLAKEFPNDEDAIRKYCDAIKAMCAKFPLYNLQSGGSFLEKMSALELDTKTFVDSLTENKKLQDVLVGTNLLYAGTPNKTPFYVHALIMNSYIESSWRFIDGGSQIARFLHHEINLLGGKVIKHMNVVKIKEEDGLVRYVETDTGRRFYGKQFISNVHPSQTMDMVESSLIKKAYRSRIKSLENSTSTFYVNAVMKKDSFPHFNHNYYIFQNDNPWHAQDYTAENWPLVIGVFFTTSSDNDIYTDGVTVMAYMRFEDVEKWKDTFNTVSNETSRGEDYEAFKKEKSEMLIDCMERRFPGFRAAIHSYTSASPLSARDYIGTEDGSLYGLTKDYRDPMKTFISPRTKVPNLLLTGQNLNLHGVLGVTVSAVLTCSQLVGMDYLVEKIKNA